MTPSEFTAADTYHYDRRSPLRWVVSHVLRYPAMPAVFLLTVIGMAATQSLAAVFVGRAFDTLLAGAGQPQLATAALLVAAAWLGYGACDIVNSISLRVLGQRVERDARDELYLSLLGKSQTFHGRQRVGDLMARATNDVQQVTLMVAPNAGLIVESIMTLVVPLVTIGLLRAELLLVPMLFLVSFGIALRRYNAALRPVAGGLREQFGAMNVGLAESIAGIEVVKGFAQEPQEQQRFSHNAGGYRDWFVRQGKIEARYLPLLLYGLAVGLAFGHALLLVLQGRISVGQAITFMALLDALRSPTFFSLTTFSLVQLGLASAQRILALITTETELDENAGGHSAPMRGEIAFAGVSFGYHDHRPLTTDHRKSRMGNGRSRMEDRGWKTERQWSSVVGRRSSVVGRRSSVGGHRSVGRRSSVVGRRSSATLKDISFTACPGETIAIVGQTGAGKTTLTRLVNRTFDADAGRVLIDGVDVRDWSMDSLRAQIATIEQDIFLFSRTIAENIAFGARSPATREQIEAAARLAQAHDFIAALPAGYETVVGERGVTLSGGQRQRIAIARAFLSDPRILILDDSTSAVDSTTEDQIQRAMRQLLAGRTTLLITHRLAPIRRANRILLLRNGELIAQGSHAELLATSEVYRRIFAPREQEDAQIGRGGEEERGRRGEGEKRR